MDSKSCRPCPSVRVFLSILCSCFIILSRFNKPVCLTAFGLVTQNNAAVFVPFNSTLPPLGNTSMSNILSFFLHEILITLSQLVCNLLSFLKKKLPISSRATSALALARRQSSNEQSTGVTDSQRSDAYAQWLLGLI